MPIVGHAIEKDKIVGAICNAASFMAKCGLLNDVKHTGNGLEQLKLWGGDNYTNPDGVHPPLTPARGYSALTTSRSSRS